MLTALNAPLLTLSCILPPSSNLRPGEVARTITFDCPLELLCLGRL